MIDAEIDDIPVYDKCYIESISVATAARLCGEDKNGCDFIPVYISGTGLTYVDMDGDGKITDCDINIIDKINGLVDKMSSDDVNNKYDINGDGFVNLADLACIVSVILGDSKSSDYPNTPELTGDGEVTIADRNDWINYILNSESKLTDEERVFMRDQFDEETGKRISEGMFDKYIRILNDILDDPTAITYKSKDPLRHVRLCLSSVDIYLKGNKSLSDDLFIVKVKAHVGGNIAEIVALGCGWDTSELTGAAYNPYPMYSNFMDMASTQADTCDSNMDDMVDFILKYNAFDFAMRTGDWCSAWDYFKNLKVSGSSFVSSGKGCGCHGIRW